VGPVAVFGASNFPLAFSVAGGDTASALAAGCPVVVKGHPAHPGTSEMVASALVKAVRSAGLPEGVFSLLNGTSHELGGTLVADPRICAVGFTGSRAGGLALMRIAAGRAVPIPVYAEMSAVNPVVLMRGALEQKAEELGKAYAASLSMGVGQFCTNPGIVLAIDSPGLERFVQAAAAAVREVPAGVMLTSGIAEAYERGVERLSGKPEISVLATGPESDGPNRRRATLFGIDANAFGADPEIAEEVFGAASVLVRCADADALIRALEGMEGQLTTTLHFTREDEADVATILPMLEPGRARHRQWLAYGRGGGPCDSPWRPVSRHIRRPQHVGRLAGDRALPAPGLLPGFPRHAAAAGSAGQRPRRRSPQDRRGDDALKHRTSGPEREDGWIRGCFSTVRRTDGAPWPA
jgi:NADP-dependent aldehyde dehydrogenase